MSAEPQPSQTPPARNLFSARAAAFAVRWSVLLARGWPRIAHARFWAEDGTLFFADALALGPRSLLVPYAGYFHVLPRPLALAVAQLRLELAPALLALLCSAIAAGCFCSSPRSCPHLSPKALDRSSREWLGLS